MQPTTPFLYFTRPYGFDPAVGNSMHFIFIPIEVKILALMAAAATFFIVRQRLSRQKTPTSAATTALMAALVIASLVISARSDMNIAEFIVSVERHYHSRHGDDRLSLIDDNMAIYVRAKEYVDAGYAVVPPQNDLLIPKLNAQYILAPILPEEPETATYIIVTDTLSNYDQATRTLTSRVATIGGLTQVFAHGKGATGLYKKDATPKDPHPCATEITHSAT